MRVLPDETIKRLLKSLTADEIVEYQTVLLDALQRYNKDPTLIPQRVVISRNTESTHLFMPCFNERAGVKTLTGSKEGYKGSVSIIDESNGDLLGVLNAMTLTAFRTALTSTIPLMRFFNKNEKNQQMTVFGNGLQAYWHIRLTLVLFADFISRVQIVARSKNEKLRELEKELIEDFPNVQFSSVESCADFELSSSSILYGCIPSTSPSILYQKLNKKKPTYISIIGSYKPHMLEADEETVKTAANNGKIIVDSSEHALLEAGELIQNKINKSEVIEIGQLDQALDADITRDGKLVLVKIVGLAIMDISIGTKVLEISEQRNIGVNVDFY